MMSSLLLLTSLLTAADKPEPNIYVEAKVGDWVEFKSINVAKETVLNKQTVIAKSDEDATIKLETSINGKASPPFEYKASLKPRPDPKNDPTIMQDVKTETVKLDSGKETLTLGGKTYDCEWEKYKHTLTYKVKGKDKKSETISKRWACKDVPLGGTVRVESESDGKSTVTELVGFGRGK